MPLGPRRRLLPLYLALVAALALAGCGGSGDEGEDVTASKGNAGFVDWPLFGRVPERTQYLPAEAAHFRDIVRGVVDDQRRLDPMIDEALSKGWPLKRIETVIRAILRAGVYELDRKRDVPARVVVTEYVDVAHAFVDREETGMVNAVLDQLARHLRAAEFDAAAG